MTTHNNISYYVLRENILCNTQLLDPFKGWTMKSQSAEQRLQMGLHWVTQ